MQWIHQKTVSPEKSDLISLPGDLERTLMFDFLPLGVGEINGLNTRFHLYSVPGQVGLKERRSFQLKGTDGVIFVADSQKERLEENLESMEELKRNLKLRGYSIEEIPFVIQYNKRDLPNALSVAELRAALNKHNAPDFEATAAEGKGVYESFKTITKSIIHVLKGGEL
jgi:signal recognition particle receptor subunit beta